jgi:hypothetical protein
MGKFTKAAVTTAPDRSAHSIIFTGRSGIGKTYFVSTLPRVFIIPVEQGLKGASPNHTPAKFEVVPLSVAELIEALTVFRTEINAPIDGKRPFAHLAVDSLSGSEALVHKGAQADEKARHMESKEFSVLWSAALEHWKRIQIEITKIRETGTNVWLIAHATESSDSTTEGDLFKKADLMFIGPEKRVTEVRNLWRNWAGHVFFLDWLAKVTKGGKGKRSIGQYDGRILYTRETAHHYAKTRLALPEKIPATCEDLFRAMAAGSPQEAAKLKAQIEALLPTLSPENRVRIEKDLVAAKNAVAMAAVLSRTQGMAAVAEEEKQDEGEAEPQVTAQTEAVSTEKEQDMGGTVEQAPFVAPAAPRVDPSRVAFETAKAAISVARSVDEINQFIQAHLSLPANFLAGLFVIGFQREIALAQRPSDLETCMEEMTSAIAKSAISQKLYDERLKAPWEARWVELEAAGEPAAAE